MTLASLSFHVRSDVVVILSHMPWWASHLLYVTDKGTEELRLFLA